MNLQEDQEDMGDLGVPPLIALVISGEKPACLFEMSEIPIRDRGSTESAINIIKTEQGLDVEELHRGDDATVDTYICARPGKFRDLLSATTLADIPVLKERVSKLITACENMSIAKALYYIANIPRIDEEYTVVQRGNIPRPEVSILEGALLGFKPCCTEYYVKTRYLGEPRDESEFYDYVRINEHVLCPCCAQEKIRTGEFQLSKRPEVVSPPSI
ncbi:MAG: hypothetical protein WCT46_03560 [Candidatus Gracilibacteria bacterium]|jgi:hypothetical protein